MNNKEVPCFGWTGDKRGDVTSATVAGIDSRNRHGRSAPYDDGSGGERGLFGVPEALIDQESQFLSIVIQIENHSLNLHHEKHRFLFAFQ